MQQLSTITGSMMPSEQTTEGVSSSKISSSVVPTLIKSLIEFQKTKPFVEESEKNPFHKSSFAPLKEVQKVCSQALSFGIGYSQSINDGYVSTILLHESGETWVADRTPIKCKDGDDPQKYFGGVTYARRYSLLSAFGIRSGSPLDRDDDANFSSEIKVKQNDIEPVTRKFVSQEPVTGKLLEINGEKKTLDINGILNGIIACKSQQQLKDFAQEHIVKSKFDDDVMKKIKTSYSAHLLYLKNNT